MAFDKLAHNLPLQEMISGVIRRATEKLAADEKGKDAKVKQLLSFEKKEHGGHIPSVKEEEEECPGKTKTAVLTDDDYIEKLAAAVDIIAANVQHIEVPVVGLLGQTLQKMAGGKKVPPAVSGEGSALATTESIGGEQQYKKDQASTNTPEKEKGKPLSSARPHDGHTQLDNNMHSAPGNNSGQVPHTAYPAKGPLVNLKKTATIREQYIAAVSDNNVGTPAPAPAPSALQVRPPAMAAQQEPAAQIPQEQQVKMAGQLAREFILQKLAGEDVMKANITSGKSGGPLVGDGVQKAYDATQNAPHQAGDPTSGFGNQARKLIASNNSTINATKKDAKGPVKAQLKEVLDEPALSVKTDSKLKENLRSTGEAGVKIAVNRAALEKIAKDGSPEEKQRLRNLLTKQANDMAMGGGMSPTASAGDSPDGCTCGHTGQCRVCKLKGALDAAKGGGSHVPAKQGADY